MEVFAALGEDVIAAAGAVGLSVSTAQEAFARNPRSRITLPLGTENGS